MALTLAPFDKVQALLDLSGGTVSEYPALEVLQDWVQGSFEAYLDRTLEESSGVEVPQFGVEPTSMIPLSRLPVSSINSISLDGEAQDPDAYNIAAFGVQLNTAVSRGSTVEVDYTGGYTDASLPSDLQRAGTIQVVHEFQIRDHIGAQSVQTEGGTVDRPAIGLLDEVTRILDPYVHPIKTAANVMI